MTGVYPGSSGYSNPVRNGITANGSSSSSSSNSGRSISQVTTYRSSTEVITLDDCDSDDDNGGSGQINDYQKQHQVQEENAKHVMNGSQSGHSSAVLSALRGVSNSAVKSSVKPEPMVFPSSMASASRTGHQDVIDLIGDDDSDNDFLYSKPSFNSVRRAPSPSTSSFPPAIEDKLSSSADLDLKPSTDDFEMSVEVQLPSAPSQSMPPIDLQLDDTVLVEDIEIQLKARDIDLSGGDILDSNSSAASTDRTPLKNSSQLADSGVGNTSGRRKSNGNGDILDSSSLQKESNGSGTRIPPGGCIAELHDAPHNSVPSPAGGNRNLAQLYEFIEGEETSCTSLEDQDRNQNKDQDRTQTGLNSPPKHYPSFLPSSSSASKAKSPDASSNHVIIPSFSSHKIADKDQINNSVEIDNGEDRDPEYGSFKRDRSDIPADCDDDLIILCSPKVDLDKKVLHTLARSSMFASINGAEHPR